jgi:molybdate transport system permease protein
MKRASKKRITAVPRGLTAISMVAAAFVAVVLAGLASRVPWTSLSSTLRTPAATSALGLSLVTATTAAVIATGLGVPVGWVLARRSGPGFRVMRAFVLLPMVLPPVVAGVALLSTFGRRGLLGGVIGGIPFTPTAVVIAQVFVALPFVVLTVEAGARGVDAGLEEAAAVSGASRWFSFIHVVLPLLRPSILAAALLAWARSLGEFGATITFAGSVEGRTRTLPLAVANALQEDPQVAVALSMVLLVISLAVLLGLRDRWLGHVGSGPVGGR